MAAASQGGPARRRAAAPAGRASPGQASLSRASPGRASPDRVSPDWASPGRTSPSRAVPDEALPGDVLREAMILSDRFSVKPKQRARPPSRAPARQRLATVQLRATKTGVVHDLDQALGPLVPEDPDGHGLGRQALDDVAHGIGPDLAPAPRREVEAERVGSHRHREKGVLLARDPADLHACRCL